MAGETAHTAAGVLKEEGNLNFRQGKLDNALALYSKALSVVESKDERLLILKNRSQCFLKMKRFGDAEMDASEALKLKGGDVKALFRRAQALEALDKPGEALRDIRRLLQIEPKCSDAVVMLRRLEVVTAKLVQQQTSTEGRINSMLSILKDASVEEKKIVTALNNLTSLCPSASSSGIAALILRDGLAAIVPLCHHKSGEIVCAALRCLMALGQDDKPKSLMILEALSSATIFSLASQSSLEIVVAAGALLKSLLSGLTQIKPFCKERDTYEAERKRQHNQMRPFRRYKVDADVEDIVDSILTSVVKLSNSYKVSGAGRDSLLQVLISTIGRKDGIFWAKKLLKIQGSIHRILEVGAAQGRDPKAALGPVEAPGFNVARLDVTKDSRMHASVLLNIVYDDLDADAQRSEYTEACQAFILDLLSDDMLDTKVEAMNAISTLLQGPFDVGMAIIGHPGILEGMLLLAKSSMVSHQRAALETIVHSYSKRDKCSGVIQQAVPILRELYQSGDHEVKVRALVGLCKLGSSGGGDASLRAMADGSSVHLARSCIRLLQDAESSNDTSRWAVEGLAYLSLEAEVKEELSKEETAMKRLMNLSKDCTHGVLYSLATTLVNLTNSYERPDILPEMRELAKFSKQHVPEDDPRDAAEFVRARVDALVSAGGPSALFAMTTRSAELPTSGTREQLSRVYLAIASEAHHRGSLVQAGAGKALLKLATDTSGNSDSGRGIASQALAKIGITMDPRLAFPGQRSLEVVRPLIGLLNVDRTSLQNFEALMALTNVATISDRHRERILQERGFGVIEHYMFEEHDDLKRAAVECVCNLAGCQKLQELYIDENERVKLLVLFSAEYEDPGLVQAASGALAMMAHREEICQKITKVNNWFEIIQTLAANPEPQLSHRGAYILQCMMEASRELAEFLMQSNTLEVLMALSQVQGEAFAPSRQSATRALAKGVEYGLIQPSQMQTTKGRKTKRKKTPKKEKDDKKEEVEEDEPEGVLEEVKEEEGESEEVIEEQKGGENEES